MDSNQTHLPAASSEHRWRRALRQPRMLTPLVLCMGFIGATLRYLLELALPTNGGLPFATLIVNIFGCFMLEIINQYVGRRLHLPMPVVKSLGLGLVGAFTTLSALSTENLAFIHAGDYGLSALYLALTIATTFVASLAGHYVSGILALRRLRRLSAARQNRQGDDA